eukprot:Rhum_TRINITY_DN16625_c0_g1::Rhum_TRINITY_DN16625_c0_g1_i1::g.163895::m.163895
MPPRSALVAAALLAATATAAPMGEAAAGNDTWTEDCHAIHAPAVQGAALSYSWGAYNGVRGVLFHLSYTSPPDGADGWGAVGLRTPSPAAGMAGFDMYAVASREPGDVVDFAPATGNFKPYADVSQDAVLVSHSELNGHSVTEFFRRADADAGDVVLEPGGVYDVATAWGPGSPEAGHLMLMHTQRHRAASFTLRPCATPAPPGGVRPTPDPASGLPVTATPPVPVNTQHLPRTNKPPPTAEPPGPTPLPVPPPPPTPVPVTVPVTPGPTVAASVPPKGAAPASDGGTDTTLVVGLLAVALVLFCAAVAALLFAYSKSAAAKAAAGAPGLSGGGYTDGGGLWEPQADYARMGENGGWYDAPYKQSDTPFGRYDAEAQPPSFNQQAAQQYQYYAATAE